jgi:hypothetical protein
MPEKRTIFILPILIRFHAVADSAGPPGRTRGRCSTRVFPQGAIPLPVRDGTGAGGWHPCVSPDVCLYHPDADLTHPDAGATP